MAEIRVKRVKAKLPALRIPMPVMRKVGKVAEGSILDNIKKQRQADGSPLKENAPSTQERKRRLRRPLLSLVDELHRFVQGNRGSWHWYPTKKGEQTLVVITPATAELRRLVRYVQDKGYTGWFAVSKKGEAGIRKIFRDWIKGEFRLAARQSGGR